MHCCPRIVIVAQCLLDRVEYFFNLEIFRNRRERNIVKEEKNDVYGIYYHTDGQHVDEGIDEIVDTNDYYGI